MSIEKFVVDVPQADLDELRRRLAAVRWPISVTDDWSEGTSLPWLQSLVERWGSTYDWRAAERRINELPQVMVGVEGTAIHAVHRRGVGPDPMPLVLSHGWPSSFYEWHAVVDALADPAAHGGDPADAFHVVAPSLPGYGFSAAPRQPGMTPRRIAALWGGLMAELGYDRFAAHGCDWGAYVTSLLGLDLPDRVIGIHMGMVSLSAPSTSPPTADDESYRQRVRQWRSQEHGYVGIQSTKPQSLAVGLADSPAGLAAWIAEKWRAWTDCDGDLENAVSVDDLLTTISLYWFTNTVSTANRLYFESRQHPVRLDAGERVKVPAGFLLESPGEATGNRAFLGVPRIGAPPIARAEAVFDVERWTIVERGGHFPALEISSMFVDEVRAFFRPQRSAALRAP